MINWRPVVAALSNDDLRPVIGRMFLGDTVAQAMAGVSTSKQRRLLGVLVRSGLLSEPTGDAVLDTGLFSRLLRETERTNRDGIHRFLNGDVIEQYPANRAERGELLAWVAERVLAPGEKVDESTINARLERFSPDVAILRRYLVDYALLERRRDGSEYSRALLVGTPPDG